MVVLYNYYGGISGITLDLFFDIHGDTVYSNNVLYISYGVQGVVSHGKGLGGEYSCGFYCKIWWIPMDFF